MGRARGPITAYTEGALFLVMSCLSTIGSELAETYFYSCSTSALACFLPIENMGGLPSARIF
jgi:hypothetical protein